MRIPILVIMTWHRSQISHAVTEHAGTTSIRTEDGGLPVQRTLHSVPSLSALKEFTEGPGEVLRAPVRRVIIRKRINFKADQFRPNNNLH